jgi:hypothetical protein
MPYNQPKLLLMQQKRLLKKQGIIGISNIYTYCAQPSKNPENHGQVA